MKHSHTTEDLQEQASLYAAGAMTDTERLQYTRHLEDDQCGVCQAEVNELQAAASMLAFIAPSVVPSPAVRGRLFRSGAQHCGPRGSQIVDDFLPPQLDGVDCSCSCTRRHGLRFCGHSNEQRIAGFEQCADESNCSTRGPTRPDTNIHFHFNVTRRSCRGILPGKGQTSRRAGGSSGI